MGETATAGSGAGPAGSPEAEVPGASRLPSVTEPARRGSGLVPRLIAHLAVAATFVVPTVRSLERGWLPLADTAAISLRSWDVLTSRSPLIGTRTVLSGTYDLGPLEYWLLTIPVHLDPSHGALWGAALCCIIAASLAIEATRVAFGSWAGMIAAGAMIGCLAWAPSIASGPTWNPHIGMIWFFTVIAATCAVMCGRALWWPLAVFAASVAMQCHLMFALPSFVMVVIGLVSAVRTRRRDGRGYRFLLVGVVVGIACWLAPLVQELQAGSQGNITKLLSSQSIGAKTGLVFGLKALSVVVLPPIIWWSHTGSASSITALVAARSVWSGVAALVLLAVPMVVAWRLHSRRLFALATVTLVTGLALVVDFGDLPKAGDAIVWLVIYLFPAGVLCWVAVLSAISVGGSRLLGQRAATRTVALRGRAWVLTVPLGALLVLGLVQQAEYFNTSSSWALISLVSSASHSIEAKVPPQPIRVVVTGLVGLKRYAVAMGVTASLDAAGYRPELNSFPMLPAAGPAYGYTPGTRSADVYVFHAARHIGVRVTIKPPGWEPGAVR